MSLATVLSRAQNGLAADLVTVEVHLAPGLPGLNIVGLPEAAVREAKDRVKAALQTCGYQFPNRRMTCNLAPADLPKEGARFDLAIALGLLAASGQIPEAAIADIEVLGELSLSGEIRPVRGALPAALKAAQAGRRMLVPAQNAEEAALARDAKIYPVRHLGELCAQLHANSLVQMASSASGVAPAAVAAAHGVCHVARNKFERFRGVLELISRFEMDVRRCGFFFERFEFLVCSKFNHTHNVAVHVHVLWPVCTHTTPSRMLRRP